MSQLLLSLTLLFTGITLGLVAVDLFTRGFWRKLFVGVMFLVLAFGVRLVFLDNDVAWQIYAKKLKVEKDIISRQRDSIQNQIKSRQHFREKDNRYFALGSSQANALFDSPRKIFYMGMSGLSCYEYPFFIGELLSKRPRAVILYFSELDLARRLNLEGLKYLPTNGGYLVSLLKTYVAVGERGWGERLKEACFVAYENLVPEVRYAFIIRNLLNKYIAVPSREIELEEDAIRKRVASREKGKFLASVMADASRRFERIPFDEMQWLALEKFIAFFEKKGIPVVILEGQYYPAVMSSAPAIKAHRVFHDRLWPMMRKHPNVEFIPRAEQVSFQERDYRTNDWVHVTEDAAQRYNEYLLQRLA